MDEDDFYEERENVNHAPLDWGADSGTPNYRRNDAAPYASKKLLEGIYRELAMIERRKRQEREECQDQ